MTINCRGTLLDLSTPLVMGILNITPDSFFDGGRYTGEDALLAQAEKMLEQGARVLDIGGMSSRPGAELIDTEEELKRVLPAVQLIAQKLPSAIISVDTIRAAVATAALDEGAHIINDIAAGRLDDAMLATVAKARAPYVLMHMQGLPNTMQHNPQYTNVTTEVADFFAARVQACRQAGITDVVLDPGFGFGKTVEHNYTLLHNLSYFRMFNLPVLAGVSRKSMICKPLGINPAGALNGTTVANTIALLNGAHLLRVHDVKEANEAITIVETMKRAVAFN